MTPRATRLVRLHSPQWTANGFPADADYFDAAALKAEAHLAGFRRQAERGESLSSCGAAGGFSATTRWPSNTESRRSARPVSNSLLPPASSGRFGRRVSCGLFSSVRRALDSAWRFYAWIQACDAMRQFRSVTK